MVGFGSFITICITLCITLLLPIAIYVLYGIKNKGKGVWVAWLLGAAGFFVFQMMIRTPLLNILSLLPGFQEFGSRFYVLYCLLLAFTAGLFEVAGRFIVAKILIKNMTFEKGVAAGLGHGGIESIVVVGMTYVNNLIYAIMINTGAFDAMLKQAESAGAHSQVLILEVTKNGLINTEPGVFLLAGYERILTMIFHLALSLLVCYFVSQKKPWKGVLMCLGAHTMVDFIVPLVQGMSTELLGDILSTGASYVIIYSFLTIVAIASVLVILMLKKKFQEAAVGMEAESQAEG